jgi:hypothetical protein
MSLNVWYLVLRSRIRPQASPNKLIKYDVLAMSRRRRARPWMKFGPVADGSVLIALGAFGVFALLYWPDQYVTDLCVPVALIILFGIFRRA